jgi:hypothetical protein
MERYPSRPGHVRPGRHYPTPQPPRWDAAAVRLMLAFAVLLFALALVLHAASRLL